MEIYVLTCDQMFEDSPSFVSEIKELVVREAIIRSEKESEYTFIMETWKNGNLIGEFRFFRRGQEVTDFIKKSLGVDSRLL